MRLLGWLCIALIVFAVGGCGYVVVSGSAIVHDHTGQVASANLTNDDRLKRSLWRLPGGIFFGIPDFDGVIEVHCRDGSIAQAGYVTGGVQTSVTVVSGKPCRLVENV